MSLTVISGDPDKRNVDAVPETYVAMEVGAYLLTDKNAINWTRECCYDPKNSKLSVNINHSKSLNFLRCNKEIKQGDTDVNNTESK